MNDLLLRGCQPEPLAAYLTGLGIFRLVAEQADASASARWSNEGLVLKTLLDRAGLEQFLLEEYEPTPLLSPWNKGSGFRRDGKSRGAETALAAIEQSRAPRLSAYREAIAVARTIADDYPDEKDFDKAKEEIIARARAQLPERALTWLDAAVVLTTSGVAYPHLLGTGGNLGRLDLATNVNQHLDALFNLETGTPASGRTADWLAAMLDGEHTVARLKQSVGQYEPGAAGGVNASTLDGADALVNPWMFVLSLEGSLLFCSAAARRLDALGDNVAAMPFTVRSTQVGAAHLAEAEQAKGELWLPLWSQSVSLSELSRLIGEGRLRWGSRQARDAVDAARAIATLGADRGLDAFVRVTIAQRLGQNPLAVPSGRLRVGRHRHSTLTGQLDGWVRRVRRGQRPRAVAVAARAVDEALFDLATAEEDRVDRPLRALLAAIAELDRLVSRNDELRKEVPPPPRLEPATWVPLLDDGSPEFALAVAFSGLHDRTSALHSRDKLSYRPSFTQHLRPIMGRQRWSWNGRPALVEDPRRSGIAVVAAKVHAFHARHVWQDAETNATGSRRHRDTGFDSGAVVPGSLVEGFLQRRYDERRVAELVVALSMIDPYAPWPRSTWAGTVVGPVPVWRLLVPFFTATDLRVERDTMDGSPSRVRLRPTGTWPQRLGTGPAGVTAVCREALTRLRANGLAPIVADVRALAESVDGRRLAGALLLRTRISDVEAALSRIAISTTEPSERST